MIVLFDMDAIEKKFKMIIDLYVALYKKVAMNPDYNFRCNNSQAQLVYNFISQIGESKVGPNYIRSYFEFQFNYWYDLDTKFGKGTIMLNWIIGKKAIDRWNKRNTFKFRYHILYGLKKAVKLDLRPVSIGMKQMLTDINDSEEKLKTAFFNTEKGFMWCYSNTTMYNHKSANCLMCNFKELCKERVRIEQPNIYSIRGYGEKGS